MIYKYDNKEVFVEVTGEGEAVLLLHGWGCTHDIFKAIATILSTKYKVYSFDFPGFGASQEPDEVWGVEEYTRLIEKFVSDNHIESPSLVGHSFGGRVSILYSSRNSTTRVVLVDAAGISPNVRGNTTTRYTHTSVRSGYATHFCPKRRPSRCLTGSARMQARRTTTVHRP